MTGVNLFGGGTVRRLILMISLLVAGAGMLLTGALPAVAGATITVTPSGSQSTVTSTPVSLQMHASDSAAPGITVFSWAASGLPTGLAINAAGLISGTPTVQGTFSVTVTATDTVPATATVAAATTETGTAAFTWTITAGGMGTTPPPTATAGCYVSNPGHQSSLLNVAIPPLQLHATDPTAPGAVFTYSFTGLPGPEPSPPPGWYLEPRRSWSRISLSR